MLGLDVVGMFPFALPLPLPLLPPNGFATAKELCPRRKRRDANNFMIGVG